MSNIGNILVEPGAGHFAWSDRDAEILALFITRAAGRLDLESEVMQLERLDSS